MKWQAHSSKWHYGLSKRWVIPRNYFVFQFLTPVENWTLADMMKLEWNDIKKKKKVAEFFTPVPRLKGNFNFEVLPRSRNTRDYYQRIPEARNMFFSLLLKGKYEPTQIENRNRRLWRNTIKKGLKGNARICEIDKNIAAMSPEHTFGQLPTKKGVANRY